MKWTDESPPSTLPCLPQHMVPPTDLPVLNTDPAEVDAWVLLPSGVHAQVLQHLRERDIEQGGLLLGEAFARPDDAHRPAVVRLLEAVRADDADGTGISLRIESSVWSTANRRLDALRVAHPGARVVGWYHSHPGLGAFFSSTDRRTQRAFFRESYSVGWVVDPTDDSHACYLGADARVARLARHDGVPQTGD